MKILYDHQVFSILKYGGITRYFCELMKHLPAEHQFDLSLIFSDNHYIRENREIFKTINLLPDKNFKGKHFIRKALYSLNQFGSTNSINSSKYDLFHPTFYDTYFLKDIKKPYIITVHDLIAIKFNDKINKKDAIGSQIETVIKKAHRIISVSHNTKKDLVEFFNLDPAKIDVIYHGYNEEITDGPHHTELVDTYGKYILFVGHRSHYKNFDKFSEAISPLLKREKELRLICVGAPFKKNEKLLLSKLKIENQTIAVSASDNVLKKLYSQALAFVYPSLYEGFGMPILEAFANNCVVCLSNTSCFPEIAGEAGVYFDPYDCESILHAIEKVIYDNDYANEKVIAGVSRLTDFSWQKAAVETTSSYIKAV